MAQKFMFSSTIFIPFKSPEGMDKIMAPSTLNVINYSYHIPGNDPIK